MNNLRRELQDVFRDVFNDPTIVLADEMTADDIDGWDSLKHIDLILAVEKRFAVSFATAEISIMKAEGKNIGFFLDLLDRKMRQGR